MRKWLAGVWAIATCVAACNGFGSEDDEEKAPPPTPTDNATPPPIDGKPIPGIYVSASKGKAGATGFPGTPLNTLKEGLARAKAENLRLIVCAEEYAENVELIDGVSAYGYFDCNVEPWARVTKRAIVKAPISPAMVAHDIKLPTRIEGFDVFGPDLDGTTAVGRNGTSIALEARKLSPNVFFVSDSTLRGGKAGAGKDGAVAPAATASGSARGVDGESQSFASCPDPTVYNCQNRWTPGPDGPSITCGAEPAPGAGGKGGDGMWLLDGSPKPNPSTDQRGKPVGTTPLASQFGTPCGGPSPPNTCAPGAGGGQGSAGTNGANGAWRFDAEGFVPGDGAAGGSGAPGLGGQGGGGAYLWYQAGVGYSVPPSNVVWARTSRGGSGGAGGCGGLAGGAGGGGGASIGLLAIDAPMSIERTFVEASNGGRGGAGTLGSAGKVGGAGGVGGEGAGSGGAGGSGGRGGASGHGASGPSIAIAYLGARPSLGGSVELRPGAGGEGRAGLNDPPNAIPPMAIGASIPEYEIKR